MSLLVNTKLIFDKLIGNHLIKLSNRVTQNSREYLSFFIYGPQGQLVDAAVTESYSCIAATFVKSRI